MTIGRLGAFFLVSAAMLTAQTNSDSGDIDGSVRDTSGHAVAHAGVTVMEISRGEARTLETDGAGRYRASALQPGVYRVHVEAAGFAPSAADVSVRVRDATTLETVLQIGAVASELEVNAEVSPVDLTRTQQAETVDFQQLQDLPVNGRNSFLRLALITPGVVATDSMVDETDSRSIQSPQSGLSFGGGNGRGNGFLLDGVENYLSSGGVRPAGSQESIEEFQINRNGYAAEFGNASGGFLNAITRSGGNQFHGDAFGFLRDSAYQARNFFDPAKSSYRRAQYGATLGGALRKDKTFYFVAFEGSEQHQSLFVTVASGTAPFYILSSSQEALLTYLEHASKSLQSIGQTLQKGLIPANNAFVMNTFRSNSGAFPSSGMDETGSVRIDHRFSDKDQFFFRGNVTQRHDQEAAFGALIGYNQGSSANILAGTATASDTHIFNSRWISQARLMFGYEGTRFTPDDPNGPEIDVEGFGSFGRSVYLPAVSFERHYELIENVSHNSGNHTVKFGADVNPVRDSVAADTFFAGRFQFGPGVTMGDLINLLSKTPTTSTTLSSALMQSGQYALAADLSESITSLQAFAVGIPLYYQQGFGNPAWTGSTGRYNFFVQDSWKAASKLNIDIGLRYEAESDPAPVPSQLHNLAPRFGFAYSPSKDGKTVIRGGYGLFYSRIDAQEANLPATLNGSQIEQVFVTARGDGALIDPQTKSPLSAINVWQKLLSQGVIGHTPITAAEIAQFGLIPGPNSPDRVVFGIDKNFRSPYAQQSSFEIDHAFGGVVVSASYEFTRGVHEPRTLDENLYYSGRTAAGQPTFGFYNPDILQDNVIQSTANSWYNALIIQAAKRYSKNVTLNAHYTFSKAMDEATDFNPDFEPNDQLNARAEKALSSFDQRHRFVVTAILNSSGRHPLLANWTAAPIFEAHSGQPFNVLAGYDALQDNHGNTHRPFGFGRNVGRGPDYYSADLRLSRRFALGPDSARNLEFIAEGFNLANRTNFRTLNNVVGTADPSLVPRPLVGHVGDPLAPFSFTSAYDPREFQFALKVHF